MGSALNDIMEQWQPPVDDPAVTVSWAESFGKTWQTLHSTSDCTARGPAGENVKFSTSETRLSRLCTSKKPPETLLVCTKCFPRTGTRVILGELLDAQTGKKVGAKRLINRINMYLWLHVDEQRHHLDGQYQKDRQAWAEWACGETWSNLTQQIKRTVGWHGQLVACFDNEIKPGALNWKMGLDTYELTGSSIVRMYGLIPASLTVRGKNHPLDVPVDKNFGAEHLKLAVSLYETAVADQTVKASWLGDDSDWKGERARVAVETARLCLEN